MKNQLKLLRISKNLQQKDIAKSIGVSTSYYGMIELGTRKPSLCVAYKLSKFFRTPIETIFFYN